MRYLARQRGRVLRRQKRLHQRLSLRLGILGAAQVFPSFQPFAGQRPIPHFHPQRVKRGHGCQRLFHCDALTYAAFFHQTGENQPDVRKPGERPQRAAILGSKRAGKIQLFSRGGNGFPHIQLCQGVLAFLVDGEVGVKGFLCVLLLLLGQQSRSPGGQKPVRHVHQEQRFGPAQRQMTDHAADDRVGRGRQRGKLAGLQPRFQPGGKLPRRHAHSAQKRLRLGKQLHDRFPELLNLHRLSGHILV